MISAQWGQLRQQWQANRRLRLGVMIVILVVGLHLVMGLGDRNRELAEQYRQDAGLLARLDEASRESAWPDYAAQAEAALAVEREAIPEVTSAGLAQAELQTWLSAQASAASLAEPRVRAETTLEVPGHEDLWQVIARLDGMVPEHGLQGFVRALSQGLPWVQVERLEVTEGRGTRVSLIVRGYYRRAGEMPVQGMDEMTAEPGA